jgi:carbonic anhydrase
MTTRRPLLVSLLVFATLALVVLSSNDAAPPAQGDTVTADDALRQLVEGNARFANGKVIHPRRRPADFRAISQVQNPVAVVVACSDSRVSPKLLFDAGVGDLFVIRLAGNVVDGAGVTVKGSIEYAIAELNVPLVVVLGHTNCGAVKAAVQHIDQQDSVPGAINGLVEMIKPPVAKTRRQPGDVFDNVIRANVDGGVEKLKNLQPILAPRVQSGSVKVIGGVYDLQSGSVRFLPADSR